MQQIETIAQEKIVMTKAWACEIVAIVSIGSRYAAEYTLRDFNEHLTTVSIIITIIGGLGAVWNSFFRKKK